MISGFPVAMGNNCSVFFSPLSLRAMRLKHLSIAIGAWVFCRATMMADEPPLKSAGAAAEVAEDCQGMALRIDRLMQGIWDEEHITPAPLASDGEFLRRAYLDLNGVIPRIADVRAFLADENADKRVVLIDRLLASPRYATHMATVWRNRIVPPDMDASRASEAVALQKWLRTRFAKNLRYDNLVGELLITLGGDELGPALYFQANDLSPEKLAASTAELFLGVRLQCAQCHDHPFAQWKQSDFWGLAAFFARVKAEQGRGEARMAYRLVDTEQGEVRLPDSAAIVKPAFPSGDIATEDEMRSRRVQLAIWMTARENKFFARATVNWAWGHLFGGGLVDSLDDVDPTSSASRLLDELSAFFVHSGYDLRKLWRTLALTRAYQLSTSDSQWKTASQGHYPRLRSKPLTPEQLYDSFSLLAPPKGEKPLSNVVSPSDSANALYESPLRMEFIRRMRPPAGSATEYRGGTLQALMLMNGRTMADLTAPGKSNLLVAIEAPFMTDKDRVQALFLATLARLPEDDEFAACVAMLRESPNPVDKTQALSSTLWALLNSTEFAFNH